MNDLSFLSDDQLKALYQHSQSFDAAKMSDDQLKAAYASAQPPSVAEDVAKSTAIAVPQTAIGLAGLPGFASDVVGRGVNALGNLVTGKTGSYEDFQKKRAAALGGADITAPTPQAIQGTVEQATGPFYQPKTVPGQFANTTTQFALSGGRSGLLPRIAAGVGSEAAGQLAEGTPYEIPVRIGGALAAGVGAGKIGNVLSARQAEKAVAGVTPTGEKLGDIVDQGYKAARASGTELNPTAVHQGIKNIRHDLEHNPEFPVDPTLMKNLDTILSQAETKYAPLAAKAADPMAALTGVVPKAPAAKAAVDFGELDALRRNIGTIAKNRSPEMATEAAAARSAQRQLDQMIENINPADVVKGDAAALSKMAADARGNAAAEFRLTAIDALRQRAADQAKGTHSGLNYEKSLKGQVKSFVRPDNKGVSPAMKAGLNAEEIKALRRSIGGTFGQKALTYTGNLLGGGGGLGALGSYEVGKETGGIPGGIASVVAGLALRGSSNAIARRQAERLGALIASRSPAAAAARAAIQSPTLASPAIPGLRYNNPSYNPRSIYQPTPLLGSLALPLAIAGSGPRQR